MASRRAHTAASQAVVRPAGNTAAMALVAIDYRGRSGAAPVARAARGAGDHARAKAFGGADSLEAARTAHRADAAQHASAGRASERDVVTFRGTEDAQRLGSRLASRRRLRCGGGDDRSVPAAG